jgi:formyltetrahydrofolate deformylase
VNTFATSSPTTRDLSGTAQDVGRLLVRCRDRPGVIAAIAGFIETRGGNIRQSDQYSTDPDGGAFFLRLEFHLDGLAATEPQIRGAFATDVAQPLGLDWRLRRVAVLPRAAIMVSRYDHCLTELLSRWRRGDLGCEIDLVVSNHPDLEAEVTRHGLPYAFIPVPTGGKAQAEDEQLGLLAGHCDLVVLARYMQVLSPRFLAEIDAPVINIHHSFLPAFAGARPYERAKERGVKLIGATAHYVTEELDAGPIIEQGVSRVRHSDTAADLERRGADVERAVLTRAEQLHCDDRVLVDGNSTIVL